MRSIKTSVVCLFVIRLALAASNANAAPMYFVGANNSYWDWTSPSIAWSLTDGGAGGDAWVAGSDAVFNKARSSLTTLNVTNSYPVTANSLTFNTPNYKIYSASGLSFTMTGVATVTCNNLSTAEIANPVSGTAGLTKEGNGTLILSRTNFYTGATTINAGTLQIGNGTTGNDGWIASSASIVNNAALVYNLFGTTTTYSGAISGGGTLAKTGVGTLTLSGTTANTYTGLTTVSAGELDLSKSGGYTAIAGNLAVSGGKVKLLAGNQIADTSAVTVSGTGIFDMGARYEALGAVTLAGGSITGSSYLDGASYDVQSGSIDVKLGATAAALTKTTTGTATLSATNAYTGGTNINAGVLSIATANALPGYSTNGKWTAASGATLAVQGDGTTGVTDAQVASLLATTNFASGANLGFDVATTRTYSSAIANPNLGLVKLGSGTLTLAGAASNTYTGVTTVNAGELDLGKTGTNIVAIGGNLVVNAGTAKLIGHNQVADTSAVTVSNTGVFDLGAFTDTVGAVTLDGGTISSTTGYLNGASYDVRSGTISAKMGATSAPLTKTTTGTVTLSGVNAHTGSTTVSAGTLALGASGTLSGSPTIVVGDAGSSGAILDLTAKSSFNILSGQTLKGIGTVKITGKTLTVNSGAHWAPGNSVGTNNVTGNLALAGTSDFELGTPGTSHSSFGTSDRTQVTGSLTLGGTLNLIDNAGAGASGSAGAGSYQIFTQTGTAGGSFPTINNIAGYHAKVNTATSGSVFLDNYEIASANAIGSTPVELGIIRMGESFGMSALNIQNLAATDGYREGLNAAVGVLGGVATASGGPITNLVGSASTAISVGLGDADTGTVGLKTGTVAIDLASNGSNSGYSNTTLGSQLVTVNGQVNDWASPTYEKTSGLGTLTPDNAVADSYLLNFGTVAVGDGSATLSLKNLCVSGFQDSLSGLFSLDNIGKFSVTGLSSLSFESLAAGDVLNGLTVSFADLTAGTYTGYIDLAPKSVNTTSFADMGNVRMDFSVTVVPEPGSLVLLAPWLIGLIAYAWRRRR